MSLKSDLDRILQQLRGASFTLQYWDGDLVSYGDTEPEFLVRLTHPAVVRQMLGNLLVGLPEAYVSGQLEIEGDLQRLLRLCYRLDPRVLAGNRLNQARLAWSALWQRNSLPRARANVAHHYDLGNEFFSLWLDESMTYSCAYFEQAGDDLETAQRQKLQHLCAKLRLPPGGRLLDIGCGWGALAIHAARQHGAEVVGITLSEEQRALAQTRVQAGGLAGRVDIRLQDYRHLGSETFDRVVSVGMLEHVGRAFLRPYLRAVAQALRPGGTGVLQWISHTHPGPVTPWITKYIFPGMYLPTLDEIASEAARAGLRIVDAENLRPHYALTLDAWIERFEKKADTVKRMFDERFVRMWRMYLNSACAAFRFGQLNLWQMTFTHGFSDEVPLTRRSLYGGGAPAR